jgi:GNAT superfamily N-acetyltransferase
MADPVLSFFPVTPERWGDLEKLFGERGACGGCWCMFWRLPRSQFERGKGEANRRALKKIVQSGLSPGLLAYAEGEPVGWCALAPRDQLPVLARSRILAPVDEKPVWSVSCFFVAKAWRRRGLTVALLDAAVDQVRAQGGGILEGYPHEPAQGNTPGAFVWTGLAEAFRRAGFKEVARRSPYRPIMRRTVRARRE